MEIISVSQKRPYGDLTKAQSCVTVEATIADGGGYFLVDFIDVCRRLKGIVPFWRSQDMMPGPISPSEIPKMLLDAARVGANSVEVGRDVHVRYLVGVQGVATAWDVIGPDDRNHLWRADGPTLCGPVPRDENTGTPSPIVLTVSVESLSDHSNAPFSFILLQVMRNAAVNIERALRKSSPQRR